MYNIDIYLQGVLRVYMKYTRPNALEVFALRWNATYIPACTARTVVNKYYWHVTCV